MIEITDTDRVDFLDKHNGEYILNVGIRWYWRSGYGKPHHRADSLRDAIDSAIKEFRLTSPN